MTDPNSPSHKMRLQGQPQVVAAVLGLAPIQLRVKRQLLSQKCGMAAGDVGFVDFMESLILDENVRSPSTPSTMLHLRA